MIQFSIRTFLHRLSQIRYFRHKKVDFIVIGAQKSGTSSLRHYLGRHPHISMSYTKEPHFFDDASYSSHPLSYYWYEKDFYQGDHGKLLGEVTPILSYLAEGPQRIKDYNPEIKLIMILRNPIERAYSHWNMEKDRGYEKEEFLHCIEREEHRLKNANHQERMLYSYMDRGYYAKQINRIKSLFSEDQLLFIKYEEYVARQESILHVVFNFLGTSQVDYEYDPLAVHQRSYTRMMTLSEREFLLDKYDQDISQVEHLLGWDCSDWRRL